MLKFIFYLFLFYIVYKALFGGGFKVKVYHYNQPQPAHDKQHPEEGKVTIDPRVKTQKKESKEQLGEYVDFEEVK